MKCYYKWYSYTRNDRLELAGSASGVKLRAVMANLLSRRGDLMNSSKLTNL